MKTALDSSVVVAGLLPWHEQHAAARAALLALLGGRSKTPQAILPAHALFEAYSVMTRMPPPRRVSPAKAYELLDGLLRKRAVLAVLPARAAWRMLEHLRQAEIAGGSVYDALIAETARLAGADRLLTLNARHLERVAPAGLEIIEPAAAT